VVVLVVMVVVVVAVVVVVVVVVVAAAAAAAAAAAIQCYAANAHTRTTANVGWRTRLGIRRLSTAAHTHPVGVGQSSARGERFYYQCFSLFLSFSSVLL